MLLKLQWGKNPEAGGLPEGGEPDSFPREAKLQAHRVPTSLSGTVVPPGTQISCPKEALVIARRLHFSSEGGCSLTPRAAAQHCRLLTIKKKTPAFSFLWG